MSLLNRRKFLTVGAVSMALLKPSVLRAQSFDELTHLPPIPAKYASLADQAPMNEGFGDILETQGTADPSQTEWRIAESIIESAPKNVAPVNVAGFFLDVARGRYGEDWRPYTRAWPKDAPANPIILHFFKATGTTPQGDLTAWCAAFVNWCIVRAQTGAGVQSGIPAPTRNAGSRSFRNWGKEHIRYNSANNTFSGSVTPQLGDIVVFQTIKNGHIQNSGHVGFFLDMDRTRVKVLGGNQYEGNPVIHAINAKWFPKQGGLELHSIRSV